MQSVEGEMEPADVQATLAELTAQSTADAIARHAPNAVRLVLCGGGSHNADLVQRLRGKLPGVHFEAAADHGLASDEVEAAAFAWLAWRCCQGLPGNLPSVTHAQGPRILGAIYPR
jgi:anhydro-N-acetylmuramic acid kinase